MGVGHSAPAVALDVTEELATLSFTLGPADVRLCRKLAGDQRMHSAAEILGCACQGGLRTLAEFFGAEFDEAPAGGGTLRLSCADRLGAAHLRVLPAEAAALVAAVRACCVEVIEHPELGAVDAAPE